MQFTVENKAKFDEILKRYPAKRSAILPALHMAQQQEGCLTREAMEYVGTLLELTPAQVHDTASYYTMFHFKPRGKTLLEFCTNLSCALHGADDLLEKTCKRLGVQEGGTTEDGRFTVTRVECLAACGGGPAIQVNGEWVENATEDDLSKILSGSLSYRPFEWPKSPGEPVLLRNAWKPNSTSIDVFKSGGGYANLEKHLTLTPDQIIEQVKRSTLRGRGGAGFPTGLKWTFLPKDNKQPRYLVVNADESEPGTFKDRLILENDPHQLLEACVVSSHALRAKLCYIYIRGEFHQAIRSMEQAVAEAYAAGFLGKNILGTGIDVDVVIHGGAGAYECGEETALLESLEGKRGQPRLKPPFPATQGLYGCPTIVNDVETIACVPLILEKGAEWFASWGTEKNGGPKLYCVSGHVARPGTYEAPMGRITLRELIYDARYGGGMRGGGKLRAVVPGGSSTPVLTPAEIDVAMDFDSIGKAGSMLGSAGTIVMDDSVCMVWMAQRLTYFYKHESCGKCSPCREGTGWMLKLLDKIENGQGVEQDLETLWGVTDSIGGKTLCPFGDAAIAPPQSTLQKFREEYEYHVREKQCWRKVARSFEEAKAKAGRASLTGASA
jgi:NADH-quinone oxidoreductase subunit F